MKDKTLSGQVFEQLLREHTTADEAQTHLEDMTREEFLSRLSASLEKMFKERCRDE